MGLQSSTAVPTSRQERSSHAVLVVGGGNFGTCLADHLGGILWLPLNMCMVPKVITPKKTSEIQSRFGPGIHSLSTPSMRHMRTSSTCPASSCQKTSRLQLNLSIKMSSTPCLLYWWPFQRNTCDPSYSPTKKGAPPRVCLERDWDLFRIVSGWSSDSSAGWRDGWSLGVPVWTFVCRGSRQEDARTFYVIAKRACLGNDPLTRYI